MGFSNSLGKLLTMMNKTFYKTRGTIVNIGIRIVIFTEGFRVTG